MTTLQPLRQAKHFTRWVLVWFVLSMGVAMANPLLQPVAWTEVCSATGSRWVDTEDGTHDATVQHTLACVFCTPAVVPPPALASAFVPIAALRDALLPAPTSHHAWRVSMLLAARGPPLLT
jgi:hypothetical protein